MSILLGKVNMGHRSIIIMNNQLLSHCAVIHRIVEDNITCGDYATAMSLLKTEIETIQRKIDDENNAMTK